MVRKDFELQFSHTVRWPTVPQAPAGLAACNLTEAAKVADAG